MCSVYLFWLAVEVRAVGADDDTLKQQTDEQPDAGQQMTDNALAHKGLQIEKELELKNLEYDDRVALADEFKDELSDDDWEILTVTNERIESYQVSQGKATNIPDEHVVMQDGERGTDIIASGVGTAEILLVPEDKLQLAQEILNGTDGVTDATEEVRAVQINVEVDPQSWRLCMWPDRVMPRGGVQPLTTGLTSLLHVRREKYIRLIHLLLYQGRTGSQG